MVLNFEEERLIKELKKRKPKKVLVQLPEGIKQNAFKIKEIIETLGIEVIISGETCWGGCSISVDEAKKVSADLIVHFGHAQFISSTFPILYIEVIDELDFTKILKKSLKVLQPFKKIGLSYSIQHKHDIENIISYYKKEGKEILLSEKLGHAALKGHVVGCEYSGLKRIEEKVDCFLIIGNNFHAMGASLSVEKPVVLIDVYNDQVKTMEGEKEKILKQRAIAIEKFREAKKIGIIVEIKPGQQFGTPKFLTQKLKEKGKEFIVIIMNEMTPDKLMNFYNVDCFIELACPRIAIDDFYKYNKPIITFKEALVGLGYTSWKDLLKKGVV